MTEEPCELAASMRRRGEGGGGAGGLLMDTEIWLCPQCGVVLAAERERCKKQFPYQPIHYCCKKCGRRVQKVEKK